MTTRITQKNVDSFFASSAPHLATHVTPTGKKGYYRKDKGPAFSFKGFDSWKQIIEVFAANK